MGEKAEGERRGRAAGDGDQAEDIIFRSMSVVAVENCIKEVKNVLEMASSHLVRWALNIIFLFFKVTEPEVS